MVKYLKFYRRGDDHDMLGRRWYVDLPGWEGSTDDLEMVMGADTVLDVLSDGEGTVYSRVSDEPMEGTKLMLMIDRPEYDGMWYGLVSDLDIEVKVWLCAVTKFVFGDFPDKIFIG